MLALLNAKQANRAKNPVFLPRSLIMETEFYREWDSEYPVIRAF